MAHSQGAPDGDDLLRLAARKYALEIIGLLEVNDPMRFSEVADTLGGANHTTLAQILQDLAAAGLIERTRYHEIPPRVEYRLTQRGREFTVRLEPLREWTAGN